ncbi:MAG TPA: hypothetical protein DEO84_05035 [candidate division Zixibacteria bacterium]|nr:hypothetical protein [candidate division Zixibacteria bacterium]
MSGLFIGVNENAGARKASSILFNFAINLIDKQPMESLNYYRIIHAHIGLTPTLFALINNRRENA